MSAWTVLAVVFWMLVGAAIAFAAVVMRGRRLLKTERIDYGLWLGRPCDVRFGGESKPCRIVAVSWKGAVAVRGEGCWPHRSMWIPKEQVAERIRWKEG